MTSAHRPWCSAAARAIPLSVVIHGMVAFAVYSGTDITGYFFLFHLLDGPNAPKQLGSLFLSIFLLGAVCVAIWQSALYLLCWAVISALQRVPGETHTTEPASPHSRGSRRSHRRRAKHRPRTGVIEGSKDLSLRCSHRADISNVHFMPDDTVELRVTPEHSPPMLIIDRSKAKTQ